MRCSIGKWIGSVRKRLAEFHSAMLVMIGNKTIIRIASDGEQAADVFKEHAPGVYFGENIIVSDGRFKFLISDKGYLLNPVKLNHKLTVNLPIYLDVAHPSLTIGYVSDGVYDPNNIYHFILNDFLPYMRVRNTFPEDTHFIFFKPPIQYISELLKFFEVKWKLVGKSVKVGKIYVSTCGHSDRSQEHYPFLCREDIAIATECAKALDGFYLINQETYISKLSLYISRPNKRRSLRNDVILRRSRFLNSVRIEELSFGDQFRLFRRARVIVAIHGAALINLLWARNINVVEIVPKDNNGKEFGFKCYEKISYLLGHNYRKVLGGQLINGEFEADAARLSGLVNELECLIDGEEL